MAMDRNEMRAMFRDLVGMPTEQQLFTRVLDGYLHRGSQFVAEELAKPKRTDTTSFGLEAGVYEYRLPSDVLQVTEAFWDGKKLDYADLDTWRSHNVPWRSSVSGSPMEIAIDDRDLYVYPAPDASAITTDPKLTLRCQMDGFGLTESGVPGFSDADVRLAVYAGAQEYLSFNNVDGRFDRLVVRVDKYVGERMVLAKQRYAQMLQDHNPGVGRVSSGRQGSAR